MLDLSTMLSAATLLAGHARTDDDLQGLALACDHVMLCQWGTTLYGETWHAGESGARATALHAVLEVLTPHSGPLARHGTQIAQSGPHDPGALSRAAYQTIGAVLVGYGTPADTLDPSLTASPPLQDDARTLLTQLCARPPAELLRAEAWQGARRRAHPTVTAEDIARTLPNAPLILAHLHDPFPG